MTPETLINCASTAKNMTAAALSLLVDDNDKYKDVQWKTPLSQLMRDDFLLPDPYVTEHATIEDILSHRTGLPG